MKLLLFPASPKVTSLFERYFVEGVFMSILAIIFYLAIIGFVLYLIQTYIPMPAPIKTAINVVIVILVILWLLNVLGISFLSKPLVIR